MKLPHLPCSPELTPVSQHCPRMNSQPHLFGPERMPLSFIFICHVSGVMVPRLRARTLCPRAASSPLSRVGPR